MKRIPAVLLGFQLAIGHLAVEPAGANDRLWSVNVTGGGGADRLYETQYRNGVLAVDAAMASFGLAPERRFSYFGASDRQCYWEYGRLAERRLQRAKRRFLRKSADRCAGAPAIVDFILTETRTRTVCGPELSTGLDGVATADRFDRAMKAVAQRARRGDHLHLSIAGHGGRDASRWYITLGDEGAYLHADQLQQYLDALGEKGVTVHLDAQACYSGGFVRELTRSASGGTPVCVTAPADASLIGYASDALFPDSYDTRLAAGLARYGSQLKAFACALGTDSVNRPSTSLDAVVQDWKARQQSGPGRPCHFSDLSDVAGQIRRQAAFLGGTDALTLERRNLISAYREHFVEVFQECAANRSGEDAEVMRRLSACLDSGKVAIDPAVREFLRPFVSTPTAEAYDLEMLNDHMDFLTHADPTDLARFKSAFCCLAYDMRADQVPGVCR